MSGAGAPAQGKVYDAIVVGLGIMGAATLSAMARSGASVLGIDQFAPPHAHGSSHGETRLLRVAYAEGARYVPMMIRAINGWRALEARTATGLLSQCGMIYLAPPASGLLASVETSATLHGLALREDRLSDHPLFNAPRDWRAVIEPEAGFLGAEDAVQAFLSDATSNGAKLAKRVTFKAIEPEGSTYRVHCASQSFCAHKVICCLGSWAREVFPFLTKLVRLEQHVLHWYQANSAFDQTAGFLPFVIAPSDRQFLYGFPRLNGAVKLADHYGGTSLATPTALGSNLPASELASVDAATAGYLPSLGPRVTLKPCIYDLSPDEHFILDEHPEMPGVWFFTGSSGHGFKFAPVIGEALCNAALELPQHIDIGFFSLKRFS